MVSFILLDWSCRESFHVFKYLNDQTVPRDQYEIIWIEYFDRKVPEIDAGLKEYERMGRPPMLDQWIVLGISEDIYYHKHLMYNIGITAAKGEVVTICDADVMVRPTFVESIIKAFESRKSAQEKGIVLHLDEVRNSKREYYPFNSPTFEEVEGEGSINWANGKTTGLWDTKDPLHTLNYGACMAARRDDLIAIGGADEHIDYLGHICGPYEITFRLVNAGKKEVWHQSEFLYHTWHPGTDGRKNYLGPHDGFQVSTTAIAVKYSERVMPLLENPAIQLLRKKTGENFPDREKLLTLAKPKKERLEEWSVEKLQKGRQLQMLFSSASLSPFIKQFSEQTAKFLKKPKTVKGIFRGIFVSSFIFMRNMLLRNTQFAGNCKNCLDDFVANGTKEFALFEAGDVAEAIYKLTQGKPVKVHAIYSSAAGERKFHHLDILPVEAIKEFNGKIVIGNRDGMERQIEILKRMGVDIERIVVLL